LILYGHLAASMLMTTVTYLFLWLLALLLSAFIGFVAHFARAHLSYLPERVTGNDWIDDAMSNNDIVFESKVIGAKWDDNGFWDADSNRNLIYYMLSFMAVTAAVGLWFFPDRVAVVTGVCKVSSHFGITPLFC
jgi:hypothetical protein